MQTRELVAALATGIPAQRVLFHEQDIAPYECDGLTMYKTRPQVVVLPETREEVCHVLRTCKNLWSPSWRVVPELVYPVGHCHTLRVYFS